MTREAVGVTDAVRLVATGPAAKGPLAIVNVMIIGEQALESLTSTDCVRRHQQGPTGSRRRKGRGFRRRTSNTALL